MRPAIYVALIVACAALAPQTVRAVLVSAASVMLEALPYVIGSAALARYLGRFGEAASALAGCGCGSKPGARSLPVAIATVALFGPVVAAVRFATAWLPRRSAHRHETRGTILDELSRLVPSAVLCGLATALVPAAGLAHRMPIVQVAAGALLGLISPCTLGGVALAAALRAHAPLACAGVLMTSGLVRLPWPRHHGIGRRDPLAFVLLAASCLVTIAFHGAGLVHPRLLPTLAACVAASLALAIHHRRARISRASAVSAIMLAAIVAGAPMPVYDASETSLQQVFPGEHIDFTGVYAARGQRIVRYAITCCRADAHPIAIELAHAASAPSGSWIRVHGVVVRDGAALAVDTTSVTIVPPPGDPFVYE